MIELGKVVGVWGVHGWIKLHSYTRERLSIANYDRWYLRFESHRPSLPNRLTNSEAGDFAEYQVLQCRQQGQGIVAQLKQVTDRDVAEQLVGATIMVGEEDLPSLPEGEFYWHQLIGLEVIFAQTVDVGEPRAPRVSSIIETGANDVLVCERDNHPQPLLIPYNTQTVLSVDLIANTITVDWDPSALD